MVIILSERIWSHRNGSPEQRSLTPELPTRTVVKEQLTASKRTELCTPDKTESQGGITLTSGSLTASSLVTASLRGEAAPSLEAQPFLDAPGDRGGGPLSDGLGHLRGVHITGRKQSSRWTPCSPLDGSRALGRISVRTGSRVHRDTRGALPLLVLQSGPHR